jgi:hypothetical protein
MLWGMFEDAPCRRWVDEAPVGAQSPWFALADASADPDAAVVAVDGCGRCGWRVECAELLVEVAGGQGRVPAGVWVGIQMGVASHQGRTRAHGPDWRVQVPVWKNPSLGDVLRLLEHERSWAVDTVAG